MTKQLTAFVEATENVYIQITKIISLEQEKRQALLHYDMVITERCIKNQQALVMQLENIEKKRGMSQIAAGFHGKTSDEILDSVTSEEKLILQPLFGKLRMAATNLQEQNKVSLGIASSELRILGDRSSTPVPQVTYQSNGKKGGGRNATFVGKF